MLTFILLYIQYKTYFKKAYQYLKTHTNRKIAYMIFNKKHVKMVNKNINTEDLDITRFMYIDCPDIFNKRIIEIK